MEFKKTMFDIRADHLEQLKKLKAIQKRPIYRIIEELITDYLKRDKSNDKN